MLRDQPKDGCEVKEPDIGSRSSYGSQRPEVDGDVNFTIASFYSTVQERRVHCRSAPGGSGTAAGVLVSTVDAAP